MKILTVVFLCYYYNFHFGMFPIYRNGGTRIAAITYSTRATLAFNLGQENVNSVVKACKELNSIRYSGGGTGTRYGFSLVLSEVKPLFREGSNRALILIADGKSNFGGAFLILFAKLATCIISIFLGAVPDKV